jgi:hypothetical protein
MSMSGMSRAGTIVSVVAVCALAGCGGDSAENRFSPENRVEVEGNEYAFSMPDQIEGGVVTLAVSNSGKQLHEYVIARLAPGKTPQGLLAFLRENPDGGPPEWVTFVGGVPLLSPGREIAVTRELEPATYVMLCFQQAPDGKPHVEHGMVKSFEVEGESDAEPPKADATVTSIERGFEAIPEVEAGRRTLELRNDASEPRDFLFGVLEPGTTLADLDRWFMQGMQGRAPFTFLGGVGDVRPGTSAYLTAELEAGTTYTLIDTETHAHADLAPR